MSLHTFTSRDFTRDVARAKRAAAHGTVFITDRGKPSFALLSIEEYYRITARGKQSLLDVMESLPDTQDIDFDAPRWNVKLVPAALD